MEFKDRLNEIMLLRGMSAYKLSKLLGMGQSIISDYRKGKSMPKLATSKMIASILEADEDWLIDGIGDINTKNDKGSGSFHSNSDVKLSDFDEEIEVFTNKNGVNFFLYPDDAIKIEVPIMPFEAYASSQIECYFDDDYTNREFHKTQFNVDRIGKGVYMGFKTKNDSMNGGGINDTPGGAEVLGREIGRQHWLSLHQNDYGFILMTKKAIVHKDIINYDKDTGMFTLHSRNPSEIDFEVSINDIYRIFNVIKRTF